MLSSDTIHAKEMCKVCGRKLTIGVLHRMEELTDRPEGFVRKDAPPFKKVIPLEEIIGSALNMKPDAARVQIELRKLLAHFGNELKILLKVPLEKIKQFTIPLVTEGIKRMREESVKIEAGFDGQYGKIHLFSEKERLPQTQEALFK